MSTEQQDKRIALLRKNFSSEYIRAMHPKQICLFFEGHKAFPPEWQDFPNVKEALEIFNDDPNRSFFQRKQLEKENRLK